MAYIKKVIEPGLARIRKAHKHNEDKTQMRKEQQEFLEGLEYDLQRQLDRVGDDTSTKEIHNLKKNLASVRKVLRNHKKFFGDSTIMAIAAFLVAGLIWLYS